MGVLLGLAQRSASEVATRIRHLGVGGSPKSFKAGWRFGLPHIAAAGMQQGLG
jgi:hypothetical protein